MTRIDIAVCTFRRPHIADTLRSLAGLALPPATAIRIIVADNDDTPSAQALVEKTATETRLSVVYVHAPARNISRARNACLAAATAPLLAFLDDDELATPGWLQALLAELEAGKADAVLGPVCPLYAADAPAWMVDGTFHATYPVETRGEIRAGYSCNVLFRRTAPAFADLCFREELGRSGGEDTVFFATAHQRGARLAYAPQAIVTEAVSPARATLRWLLQRRFRAGQTQVRLGEGHFLLLLKASAKMLLSYLMAVLSLLWLSRAAYWLLRGTFHLGVVCRLLGLREVTPYG